MQQKIKRRNAAKAKVQEAVQKFNRNVVKALPMSASAPSIAGSKQQDSIHELFDACREARHAGVDEAELESVRKILAEEAARLDAKRKAARQAKAEAKRKAEEEEAAHRAEEEAKKKAEAETKRRPNRKAEAEAKKKAEENLSKVIGLLEQGELPFEPIESCRMQMFADPCKDPNDDAPRLPPPPPLPQLPQLAARQAEAETTRQKIIFEAKILFLEEQAKNKAKERMEAKKKAIEA